MTFRTPLKSMSGVRGVENRILRQRSVHLHHGKGAGGHAHPGKTTKTVIGRCPRKEEGGNIFTVALTLR